MKTYLKRAQENPSASIFYASGDIPSQSLARDYLRHRIVQPSTKEQQRLLSSTSSARLQHVHWGKYGIKPLWPSAKSSCEQLQQDRQSNEVRTNLTSRRGVVLIVDATEREDALPRV